MNETNDNHARIFGELVSLNAWHQPIPSSKRHSDLYVEVSFHTARLDGGAEWPVTFSLSLRQARVVVVEPKEAIEILHGSVIREPVAPATRQTIHSQENSRTEISAHASATLSTETQAADARGGADYVRATETNRRTDREQFVPAMPVEWALVDGCHQWIISAQPKALLSGRPWDGSNTPRLRMELKADPRTAPFEPDIRVEARCQSLDLHIDDLVLKDTSRWKILSAEARFANKLRAAQAYIQARLTQEGLAVGNVHDTHSRMTVASVISQRQLEGDDA